MMSITKLFANILLINSEKIDLFYSPVLVAVKVPFFFLNFVSLSLFGSLCQVSLVSLLIYFKIFNFYIFYSLFLF